jgi:predicted N-acetyltransferase YhbS
MPTENIRYEHIRVQDLEEFAAQIIQEAESGQFIPITLQRAQAHAHNPYADPKDVALLIAVDQDGDVVGYFGILPVMLRCGKALHKCHWFTTWSVSPKVRGLGVGSGLMREALTLGKDFLIVGSVHARRVCQKFGFWERAPLVYYWIDPSGMGSLNPLSLGLRLIRKMAHILNIKSNIQPTNKATQFIDRIFSPISSRLFYSLICKKLDHALDQTSIKRVSEIRSFTPKIKAESKIELYRGMEAVNWMLTYPWVVKTGTSPTEEMDYYFSDTRPRHEMIAFELSDSETGLYTGFIVFSISHKPTGIVLKTLDYFVNETIQHEQILALAVRLGRENNAVTIEVPGEIAHPFQNTNLGRILFIRKNRIYQCHPSSENSPLAQAWEDLRLHLYDGDMAFS